MITNSKLDYLYRNFTLDLAMCELLDAIKHGREDWLKSLNKEMINIDELTDIEFEFITIMVATIEFQCIVYKHKVPKWVQDKRYTLKDPYFFDKGMSDIQRLKLFLFESPIPFSNRNIFVHRSGLERI